MWSREIPCWWFRRKVRRSWSIPAGRGAGRHPNSSFWTAPCRRTFGNGASRLDVVAIMHGHSDHIGGSRAVLKNFRPRELWVGALPETPSIRAVLEYAQSLGIRIVRRADGESFDFGGVRVSVF